MQGRQGALRAIVAALAVAGAATTGWVAPTAASAQDPGCSPGTALDVSFDAELTSGSLPIGEKACYRLPDVAQGDVVEVRLWHPEFRATSMIRTGSGESICVERGACTLAPGGPYTVEVLRTWAGNAPVDFELGVTRLNRPEGCEPLAGEDPFRFGGAVSAGQLENSVDADCYRVERPEATPDARYWFRAQQTSGELPPRWDVYAQDGTVVCPDPANGRYISLPEFADNVEPCALPGSGPFSFVVSGYRLDENSGQGTYDAQVRRTTDRSGCSNIGGVGMNSLPTPGAIDSVADVDCYTIPDVQSGDRFLTDLEGEPGPWPPYWQWVLLGPQGNVVCYWLNSFECASHGEGDHAILVYGRSEEEYQEAYSRPYDYSLRVARLNDPIGCKDLGSSVDLTYGAAPMRGSITAPQQLQCYTFTRPAGAPDEALVFRATRASGAVNPDLDLYEPDGRHACFSSVLWRAPRPPICNLSKEGEHMLLVRDSEMDLTGAFDMNLLRLSDPTECEPFPASGFVHASVALMQYDCYILPATPAGEPLDVSFAPHGGSHAAWAIFDGASFCTSIESETCRMKREGSHSLLVYDVVGAEAFDYGIAVGADLPDVDDPDPPPVDPPPVDPPPVDPSPACERARTAQGKASAELATTRHRLKRAKASDKKARIRRALKRVRRAKAAYESARDAVGAACAPTA